MFDGIHVLYLNEEGKEPWHFEGSALTFLEVVMWSMVFRDAHRNKVPDVYDIVSDPEKVMAYAKENNITHEALVNEMARICGDIQKLIIDNKESCKNNGRNYLAVKEKNDNVH